MLISQRPRGRGRRKTATPHPIDVHVGRRVRERRAELGISQERLATELRLTFQQVQKYESGANRVSASRLFHIANVLDVKPPFFFEGYQPPGRRHGFGGPPPEEADADPMRRRDAVALVKAFLSISDPSLRESLMLLARSLAAGGELK